MAIIYSISNQKGGVGKTTTTVNLSAAFAEQGSRVLIVDLDPQAGLTVSLGKNPDLIERTVYNALLEEAPLPELLLPTEIPNVTLCPANLDLAGAEAELIGEIGWERTLSEILLPVLASYDRILLDCPPSLGILTVNALVAARCVIVPLQCEFLALRALKQLHKIIVKVKKRANPELETLVLRTMFDRRPLHSKEIFEEIEQQGGEMVLQTYIQRTIKFADASVEGISVLQFAPKSEAAAAYRQLAEEVMQHGETTLD